MTTERLFATFYVADCIRLNLQPNRKHLRWWINRHRAEIRDDLSYRGRSKLYLQPLQNSILELWKGENELKPSSPFC